MFRRYLLILAIVIIMVALGSKSYSKTYPEVNYGKLIFSEECKKGEQAMIKYQEETGVIFDNIEYASFDDLSEKQIREYLTKVNLTYDFSEDESTTIEETIKSNGETADYVYYDSNEEVLYVSLPIKNGKVSGDMKLLKGKVSVNQGRKPYIHPEILPTIDFGKLTYTISAEQGEVDIVGLEEEAGDKLKHAAFLEIEEVELSEIMTYIDKFKELNRRYRFYKRDSLTIEQAKEQNEDYAEYIYYRNFGKKVVLFTIYFEDNQQVDSLEIFAGEFK